MTDFTLLNPIIKKYNAQRGSLITILQKAQELFGYLPLELVAYLAKKTKIKPARIQGVVSFYTQFRTQPIGKYHIMLCQGTACHVNGSSALFDALSANLGVLDGGTTPDGLFTLQNVACLGCCSLAPAMMINDTTHGNLTPQSAIEIISLLRNNIE